MKTLICARINLWILIFAIFMASLGLNDFELMKRSLKSFLITTLFSVTTATIFFLVSLVAEGQSDLLARTDTVTIAVLKLDKRSDVREREKMAEWLKARTDAGQLRLITE